MSQDPHDHLLLQIRGAVAEYERTLIADRLRRGRWHKLQAGVLLPWTHAPYGYRLGLEHPRDPAAVWVEPTEAAIVAEIFARYLETRGSLAGLAKDLTAKGIATPAGKAIWNPSSVRGILINPAYTGQVYAGRTATQRARLRHSALQPIGPRHESSTSVAPAAWLNVAPIPALVSQEQFDHVQAKLALNRQFARRHNTAHRYLLRALVSCGHCRLACMGRRAHPGYDYYLCRGKAPAIQSGRAETCHARYIPARQLDELVWQDLRWVLLHPDSIAHAVERAHGGHWLPQELQARRANLRRAAESAKGQIDRLTDAYLKAVIPLAEYQRRRATLEQQVQALTSQLGQLEVDAKRQRDLAGLTQSVEALCQRLQRGLDHATFEQKRELIELLIDRVVVTNGDVEIRYVIPMTPAGEHVRSCHLRTDYFDPGAQPERIAHRPLDLARLIGHEVPGGLGRQGLGVGGDLEVAHGLARAEDGLADEAPLAAAIGEDAFEGAPAGLPDALPRQHPDAVIGADGHDILQVMAVQRADERAALAVEAVGQHDAEAEAEGEQLLDDLDGQLGLALGDLARLEA
jgi:site-specific DNA recombinase